MTGACAVNDIWKCETLTRGGLDLVVLPGIGGRLWDIRWHGQSLLFQNDDLTGHVPDLDNPTRLPTRSPQFRFPLWGGEKTWIAPDAAWIDAAPYTVLDSGPYHIHAAGPDHITLHSNICPDTHLRITRTVRITNDTAWSLHHSVSNHGTRARPTGIWSVMMLRHPACIAVAGAALDPVAVFGDVGNHMIADAAGRLFRCTTPGEFKTGLGNPSGRTILRLGADAAPVWMICETPPPQTGDVFAHSRPLEVFNSGDYPYGEAEWHAPAKTLAPGQTVTLEQRFTIGSDPATLALRAPEQELITCMS